MRIIVLTCDKYDHLLPGFAHQFNKYWETVVDVTVAGFRPPPELPPNFEYAEIADGETKLWTTHMHDYISTVTDRTICLLLDDYWLNMPTRPDELNWLEAYVYAGNAQKGDMSFNTRIFGAKPWRLDACLLVADQGAKYRTSTQPAIWSRDYLLQKLAKPATIWQFETRGSGIEDGANIVQYNDTDYRVVEYANIYRKGRVNLAQVAQLSEADIAELRDLGYADFIQDFDSTIHYLRARQQGATAFKA